MMLVRHGTVMRPAITVIGVIAAAVLAVLNDDVLSQVKLFILFGVVAASPAIFVYGLADDALRSWISKRLLARAGPLLVPLARSRDSALLPQYLRERCPQWLAPGVVEAVRLHVLNHMPGASSMARNQIEMELAAHLAADAPKDSKRMVAILDRWTAPWRHGASVVQAIERDETLPTPWDYPTTIRNTQNAPLPHLERIPLLYRLHRLRQLSTVSVTTHLGATHTRLSHTVGSVVAADQMLRQLLTQEPQPASQLVSSARRALDDPVLRRSCLAYCALHDAFHGPFGHSLDIMKDVFFPHERNQKLDDKYFTEGLREALDPATTDAVGRQIRAAAELWVGREAAATLVTNVQTLADPDLVFKRPELYFLQQIVDSEIDADRIDYIVRDGFYLRHNHYSELANDVISTLRIVEWTPPQKPAAVDDDDDDDDDNDDDEGNGGVARGDHAGDEVRDAGIGAEPVEMGPENDPPTPRVCLAFARSVEEQLAELLGQRREYYTKHYEAPEKLLVDDMICHGLAYVLADKGLLDAFDALAIRVKRSIMLLTDDTFIPALLDLQADPPAYDLLFRYQQRRFFALVQSVGISVEEVVRIRHIARRWIKSVNRFLAREADRLRVPFAARRIPIEKLRQAFTNRFDRALARAAGPGGRKGGDGERFDQIRQLDLKVLSFGFQYWTQGVFRQRQEFEDEVWRELRSHRDSTDKLKELADLEYGDAAEWTRYDKFPPIHVTTPSHFGLLDKRDVMMLRKEGRYPAEEILFYDREAPTLPYTWDVKPAAKEDRPAYPIVLSAPEEVIRAFGATTLQEAFATRLRTFDWLLKVHGASPE
jgi:hypothetical protein